MRDPFARTRAAVSVYDGEKPVILKAWMNALTADELDAVHASDVASENKVREAFAADTAEVNSRDRAFLVHPDDPWLRALIARPPTTE